MPHNLENFRYPLTDLVLIIHSGPLYALWLTPQAGTRPPKSDTGNGKSN